MSDTLLAACCHLSEGKNLLGIRWLAFHMLEAVDTPGWCTLPPIISPWLRTIVHLRLKCSAARILKLHTKKNPSELPQPK